MSQAEDDGRAVDPVDVHVGARLRQQRQYYGLSLLKAGEIIGASQQQMSRVELGQTRILASQLYRLARAYRVPVTYFFEGYQESDEELRRVANVLGKDYVEWHVLTAAEREDVLLAALRNLPANVQSVVGELLLALQRPGANPDILR